MTDSIKEKDLAANLELEMTSSAIGFEYARLALQEVNESHAQSQKIISDIEAYKETYFDAREKLLSMDADRLERFENDLQKQKTALFSAKVKDRTYH